MRTNSLFALTAALALGAGVLSFAPASADAKDGYYKRGAHYRAHVYTGRSHYRARVHYRARAYVRGHYRYGHYPRRFHRPFVRSYAYAYVPAPSCWRIRYTPWGPRRVWVCGPRHWW
jgi:hypothetical protein